MLDYNRVALHDLINRIEQSAWAKDDHTAELIAEALRLIAYNLIKGD